MNRTEEEKLFSRDLAIRLYPGKWSTAKGMARERTTKCEGVDYWLLARKFYLELGGEYVEQIDPAYLAKYHGEPGAERELLIYWLLQAYNTLHREGYESGMTDDELSNALVSVLANLDYDPNLSAKAQELVSRPPAHHVGQAKEKWAT